MLHSYVSDCLSLHFNSHFPGGPWLAGTKMSPLWILLELRVMEVVSGNNWSYKTCKAPVKMSLPTNQHPVFFTDWMPFLSPNQQYQSTEGKTATWTIEVSKMTKLCFSKYWILFHMFSSHLIGFHCIDVLVWASGGMSRLWKTMVNGIGFIWRPFGDQVSSLAGDKSQAMILFCILRLDSYMYHILVVRIARGGPKRIWNGDLKEISRVES